MLLSPQSAQRIVEEIGKTIQQNINMMDENAIIIASTDATRIGHFHEGAYRVIAENLPELCITPELATSTTRTGVNLPITHLNHIVGVIGITGAYEQVIGYGKIVKKMTEILMRESTEQDEKRMDLRVRSRFLEDWVLSNRPLSSQSLPERAAVLGIDITLPRRVLVSSVQDLDKYVDTTSGQQLIEKVEETIAAIIEQDGSNMILRNNARQILIVRAAPDKHLEALANRLCYMALTKFSVYLTIGIDGNASDIHLAYIQANKSWRAARSKHIQLLAYRNITFELFLGEISKPTKVEYLHKIFAGCNYEEISQWIYLTETYFSAEGSITQAAANLFIHKNTLQYKLKKLEELTGYDIRLPSNAPVFFIAQQFYREVQNSLLLLDN
ncbi:MAG: sugar diacid recognition domain-containing protein [Oscillospiraceae bacterium]|nr:sugar diacid recognition domain-containing protein [Oscillospiraceae bacterium]